MSEQPQYIVNGPSDQIINYVLYNTKKMPIDLDDLIEHLSVHWGLSVKLIDHFVDMGDNVFMIRVEDKFDFTFIYLPKTFDDTTDLESVAGVTQFWKTVNKDIKGVKGHLAIGASPPGAPISIVGITTLMTKIISSVMAVSDALCFYYPGQTLLIRKEVYVVSAQSLKKNIFPTILWLYVGHRSEVEGIHSMYVYGLELFQKLNIEMHDFEGDLNQTHEFLLNISRFIIVNNIDLIDGQTLGAPDQGTMQISISPGRYLRRESIKIRLVPSEE